MIFIGESAPDIRWKIQKVGVAMGMNPSQLVDTAFMVCNDWKIKQPNEQPFSFKTPSVGNWNWRPYSKRKRPLGKNQHPYFDENGHWKRNCHKFLNKKDKTSDGRNLWWLCQGLKEAWGSNNPLGSNHHFPTGAAGVTDSGEQGHKLLYRYWSYVLSFNDPISKKGLTELCLLQKYWESPKNRFSHNPESAGWVICT
jgi:hypothetical protein